MEVANLTGNHRFAGVGRLTLLVTGLLIGGCSHTVRKNDAPAPVTPTHSAAITGIPSCDAYLGNYLACHSTAGTYNGDAALQSHYQAMLQSLQHDANDPLVRPYLNNRCMRLTQQMSAVLNGRTCSLLPPKAAAPK